MSAVQAKLAFSIKEVPASQDMAAGDWTLCLNPVDQVPTGRIKIQLANSSAAKELENAAHNQVVTVGGDSLAVKVANFSMMQLPRCQGNEQGAPSAPLGSPPGL